MIDKDFADFGRSLNIGGVDGSQDRNKRFQGQLAGKPEAIQFLLFKPVLKMCSPQT